MEDLSDDYLMMIEPENEPNDPVFDDLSQLSKFVFLEAKENGRYRGFHFCTGEDCNSKSDNVQWVLPTGHITNSLIIHYISMHRDEVPESEINKLIDISAEIGIDIKGLDKELEM
jgi:hypothetical protein